MKITVNGKDILTKTHFFENMKAFLDAPEEFGHNLDALHDVITDKTEEIIIEVLNPLDLANAIGQEYTVRLFVMLMESHVTVILKQEEESINPNEY